MGTQENNIAQVGPRIRLKMQDLSPKERQILQDCLTLGSSINRYSIHDVADRNQVSAAMIVKVAKHCGFSGFKELKNDLLEYSLLTDIDLHEELNPNDDAVTVVNKVFNTSINALKETLAIFDYAAIERAATALQNARTIEIYGIGGSGAIAIDAYHKYLRIGVRTHAVTDSHLIIMSASILGPGDVVIGITHSGRTHAMVEAFRLAREQKATTIVVTNNPHSKIAEYADILLYSVAQGSPITGENAAARIVQLNVLDALFVLVAQGSYEKSLQNLDITIKSVSSLRV